MALAAAEPQTTSSRHLNCGSSDFCSASPASLPALQDQPMRVPPIRPYMSDALPRNANESKRPLDLWISVHRLIGESGAYYSP